MYHIGICDDGKNICSSLEEMILEYTGEKGVLTEVKVWYSGESLCDYLKQGGHIDILFLDFIRNRLEERSMQIIYISGKASYAQELFRTQPMDFLVKPISRERVNEALCLAMKILGKNADKFEFQCGRDYYYLPFGEIMYFVSEGRKIRIITPRGEKEFYGKLRDVTKGLPPEFVSIHKSYTVNREYILRYTYESIELTDGTQLAISKANRKLVREKILNEGA